MLCLPQYVRVGDGMLFDGEWSTVLDKQYRPNYRTYMFYLSNLRKAEAMARHPVEMNEGGIPMVGGSNSA